MVDPFLDQGESGNSANEEPSSSEEDGLDCSEHGISLSVEMGRACALPGWLSFHDREGRFHGPDPLVHVGDGLIILATFVRLPGDLAGHRKRPGRGRGPRQAETDLASPESMLDGPRVQEPGRIMAMEARDTVLFVYRNIAI